MKNVTVTLPEKSALWVRIRAAEQNKSVSRWLGELIAERRCEEKSYRIAMERYLSTPPQNLKRSDDRYPSREALHDRTGLR